MEDFQKNAKNLSEKIENIIETKDSKALSFVSDIIRREAGSGIKDFCDALKALGSVENIFDPVRPNDLFRDIIRKIVNILLKDKQKV